MVVGGGPFYDRSRMEMETGLEGYNNNYPQQIQIENMEATLGNPRVTSEPNERNFSN